MIIVIAFISVHIESLKVNEGKKPFKCEICNLSFATKISKFCHETNVHIEKHLSREGKVHTEEKFKCETCDKVFTARRSLRDHKVSVHDGKKRFKCEICNLNFAYRRTLRAHKVAVHDRREAFPM